MEITSNNIIEVEMKSNVKIEYKMKNLQSKKVIYKIML